MKRVLITGAAGQDGFYLTKYLKSLGYDVWAGVRHDAPHLHGYNTVYMDMRDYMSIQLAIRKSDPEEIYNLAGQSFVPPSWNRVDVTFNVNTGGLARILEFIELYNKKIKVYQASSSEMFGNIGGVTNEDSPMIPTSPYGVSKLAAHRLAHVYRQKDLFVCSGICFNHESPKRGVEMVTRKISQHVAKWYLGDTEPIQLGSLDVYRDWGFAGDYVEAMHSMMQLDTPDDYIIATGEAHSIQEFIDEACAFVNVTPKIELDKRFLRSGDINIHKGSFGKARSKFGYMPKVNFKQLVHMMVESDIKEEMIKRDLSIEEFRLPEVNDGVCN